MFRNIYATYVNTVKAENTVQQKIKFIRSRQGQANLMSNFEQNSKDYISSIPNAYKLIDELITTNADIIMSNSEKIRRSTELTKNAKKMIDQLYRNGIETSAVKMIEDKLSTVVDNIIKDSPQHPLITSYYNIRPVTSSEGSIIHHDYEGAVKELNSMVADVEKLLVELGKSRIRADLEAIPKIKHSLAMMQAQTKEGFDYYEFDRNLHYLETIRSGLEKKLNNFSQKNFLMDKLHRIDQLARNADFDIPEQFIESAEKMRALISHGFTSQQFDKMMDEMQHMENWMSDTNVSHNAIAIMKKHQEATKPKTVVEPMDDDDDDFFQMPPDPAEEPELYSVMKVGPNEAKLKKLLDYVAQHKKLLGHKVFVNYNHRINFARNEQPSGKFSDSTHVAKIEKEIVDYIDKLRATPNPNLDKITAVDTYLQNNRHILTEGEATDIENRITNVRVRNNTSGEFPPASAIDNVQQKLVSYLEKHAKSKAPKVSKKAKNAAVGNGKHHVSFDPKTKYKHIHF